MALSLSQTKQILQTLSHNPQKYLGQNFLVDGNIVEKSLSLGEVCQGETVVEVGPGLGTLSRALLEKNVMLYAVEKDKTLYAHLKKTLSPLYPNFHLLLGDALDMPLGPLPKECVRFKIVANLPYAIATPWLEGVLRGPLPTHMVLMLQKEAADRFAAPCKSSDYSPISILLEGIYVRQPGHNVSRQCFYPVPKVDSVLLKLVKKEDPYIFTKEAYKLMRLIFTQRRKQIGSICKQYASTWPIIEPWLATLTKNNLSLTLRPQCLPFEAWQWLDKEMISVHKTKNVAC